MAKLEEGWYWFRGNVVSKDVHRKNEVAIVKALGDSYNNYIHFHNGFLIPQRCFEGEFVKIEKPEGW